MKPLLLISLMLTLFNSNPTCSCVWSLLDDEEYAALDFIGEVEVLNSMDSHTFQCYQVKVIKTYKSIFEKDTFTVHTYKSSCESVFKVGRPYLLCADTLDGELRTDICYNNYILDPLDTYYQKTNLEKELKYLRRKSSSRGLFDH